MHVAFFCPNGKIQNEALRVSHNTVEESFFTLAPHVGQKMGGRFLDVRPPRWKCWKYIYYALCASDNETEVRTPRHEGSVDGVYHENAGFLGPSDPHSVCMFGVLWCHWGLLSIEAMLSTGAAFQTSDQYRTWSQYPKSSNDWYSTEIGHISTAPETPVTCNPPILVATRLLNVLNRV